MQIKRNELFRRSSRPAVRTVAMIRQAVRQSVERLEIRSLMAVSLDENGWTVVTPASDSQLIYVSSSGDNANTGLSPDSPLKTISYARSLIGNNSADQLLLKRGDVFREAITNWTQSGRSADEPILIGTYGPSSARAVLKTGTSTDGFATPTSPSQARLVSNVVLQGISFEANLRNTDGTEFKAGSTGGENGLRMLGQANNFLVEDCSFKSYVNNAIVQSWYGGGTGFGLISNFKFRRNLVLDAYNEGSSVYGAPTSVKSQGIYVEGVQNVLLEENVFDHNGWHDSNPITGANIYNHNAYVHANSTDVSVIGNIFANAASHGLQLRPGGIAKNNLFINNPIAMSFGLVNGSQPTPGGVRGEVSGNVVIGGRDISGDARGWGLEIGNIGAGGSSISNNIFTGYANGTSTAAIQLQVSQNNDANHAVEVGINDLTITNNVVNAWSSALSISKYINGGWTNYQSLSGLTVTNNDFRSTASSTVVDHGNLYKSQYESWSGNRYDVTNATDLRFKLRSGSQTSASNVNLNTWNSTVEGGTALQGQLGYVDAGRTAATYMAGLGGTGTTDAFLAAARRQSRLLYRSAFTAARVNDYIRAGFSLSPEDAPIAPPSIRATASNILAPSSDAQLITVRYALANLDPATLDDADLRIFGPDGFEVGVTYLGSTVDETGATVATYSLAAPGSNGWTGAANGTYYIVVQSGAVLDTAGAAFAGGVADTFEVQIDESAPQAMAHVESVTTPTLASGTGTVRVGYYDPAGIDLASLGDTDVRIVRQGGAVAFDVPVKLVSITGSGTKVTALYNFVTPATGWQVAYNGTYDVVMGSGEVTDSTGRAIPAGSIGQLRVSLETTRPTPKVNAVTPNPRTTAVSAATVTFSEQVRNVDLADFVLTLDGTPISLSGIAAPTTADNITYTLSLGALTSIAGTYVLSVRSGTDIIDMAGNAMTATSSTTWVVDRTAPTAALVTTTFTAPQTSYLFSINYADPAGVATSTLGNDDVRVTGPYGVDFAATLRTIGTGASAITATYGIDLPAGWQSLPNGTYSIVLQPGAVADTLGNAVAGGAVGSFTVAVEAAPRPTAIANGPYAVNEGGSITLSASGSTSANGTAIVSHEWDYNYDGVTFDVDATGASPAFTPNDGPTTRTVGLRVIDASGLVSSVATAEVTVANVAPTGTLLAGPVVYVGEASSVSFTGVADASSVDLNAGLRYSFDFNNDGDFDDVGDVTDADIGTASYAYATAGTYTVWGRVSDKDGGFTDYTTSVTVQPAVPPIARLGGPYTVVEGGSVTLNGSASTTGGGLAVSAYEWDYNYDGVTFDVDAVGATPSFLATHIDGPSTRTIALRVTDERGLVHIATTQVNVTNAAPTATLTAGAAVTQGTASTVAFTNAADPSAVDVAAGLLYSFDFNNDGDFIDPGDIANSTSPTASYIYAAAGNYVIRGRVSDKDGSFADYTVTAVVNAPPVSNAVVVQAESGAYSSGSAFNNNHVGHTGTGFADYGGQNSAVQWSLNWTTAGQAELEFRYANGSTANRPLNVQVNGVTVGSVACPPTGAWTTWKSDSIIVTLKAGSNTIKAIASTSAGGANIDSLTFTPTTIVPPPPPPLPPPPPPLPAAVTIEAETGTFSGGTGKSSSNGGYTGTGFADYGGNGSAAQWTLDWTTASSAALTFRYANGSTANRPLSVQVNGVTVGSVEYAPTGGWATWKTVSLTINLKAGSNTIKAIANTSTGGGNVDSLTITGTGGDSGTVTPPPPPPPTGATGTISGYTFNDSDKDGVLDAKESRASGKTVFLDINNNGKFDSGEKSMVTDANGNFSFTGLSAGTYYVRRVFPTGYTYSTPLRNLTLTSSQVISGVTIGSKTV